MHPVMICVDSECVFISVKKGESPNLILDSDLDQGMMGGTVSAPDINHCLTLLPLF